VTSNTENPTLTTLLTELAGVFAERDDLIDVTKYQQDQIEQLTRVLDAHHGVPLKQNNRPQLDREAAESIRELYNDGEKVKVLAGMYQVHPSTISRIVKGVYYS
jgi:hypothetical protein